MNIDRLVEHITKPLLNEGVNDPGIFKAIFLAGGPGSGKSYVAQQLFGIPERVNISISGLKMVNQDKELETLLKKYYGSVDLGNMPDELFADLTGADKTGKPVDYDTSGLRKYAKALSVERLRIYTEGRLGVIIDGTGHKFKSIMKKKGKLEDLGYNCFMVFVNTSLEIALRRNEQRDRALPENIVRKAWQRVQDNKKYFRNVFGGSVFFLEVNNDRFLSPVEARKNFDMLAKKGLNKFLKIGHGKTAEEWIKRQKQIKKIGIKNLAKKAKMAENIKLPIKVGDTVLMGRFKNKKVKVKSIDFNEKGDLLINNRPALKFRISKSDKKLLPTKATSKDSVSPDGDMKGVKEQKEIKKTIGIYGGRFQPFHSGHMATYKWLKSKVDDVYITTSNIKKPPRHPMNFKEKVEHMVKMGVPKNRIVEEKTPYIANNVLKKFDSNTTAVVYAFGAKDAGRLKGGRKKDGGKTYYQDYNKSKGDIKGFEEHGYFLTAPPSGNLSGTKTREMLGKPDINDKEKIKFFKKAFGYYDKKMYISMTKNFGKLFEIYVSLLETTITGGIEGVDDGPHMIAPGVNRYIGRAKKEAEKLGFDIVNSLVNDKAYKSQDKLKSHAKSYPDGPVDSVTYGPAGAGEPTSNSVINLVGMEMWLKWMNHIDRILSNQEYEYADKSNDTTRKQSIRGSRETKMQLDKELKESIQQLVSDLPRNGKELLLMGGAYGHMSHPFDNNDLTFGDLKKIITMGLGGTLSREDNVTEKTDGQNIMVSWKNGKLIAARNKGHLKNKGETALDVKGVEAKFAGRGEIRNAFVYAVRDLSKAIGALSDKQREKVFGEGSKFMSLEVLWPKNENVVNYDITELMFHGSMEYDLDGKPIGQPKDSARMLAGMIKQVNQNIQKHYNIKKPNFMTVPKHQDFGRLKNKFLGKLNKLRAQYGLSDKDTLSMYHQHYWQEFIFNGAKQHKFKINTSILTRLTKRWAFFDKSYNIRQIKKDMKDNPNFLDWVLTTDKIDKNRMVKENMKPFEEIFFEVGAEILKNMDGWMAINPAKSVQNMRKKVQSAIKDVRAGGDLNKLTKLKVQLDRLNAIGGFDAIVPSEGIVFKYKGNTYKFTGAFAPVNQITGLLIFSR